MGITTKIYNSSSQEIPWGDWEYIRKQSKEVSTMDPRFLNCLDRTMAKNSNIWYVLFYDESDTPIASACLSTMRVDLAIIAGTGIQRTMGKLRKVIPSLLNLNIMFCGLPISLGQKSLLFVPQANPGEILAELDGLVLKIARQQKAGFIVYKEHSNQELGDMESLIRRGYRQAESLDMHIFDEPFQDFEHYLSNLNSHYRYDIRRSLRKLERAGVEIVRWTDPETIRNLYTEELHQLYYAVVEKSETRLEVLPVTFFHELTRQFPGQVALTGMVKDGKVLAFNWSLTTDSSYQFMFCGIDYSINNKMDLYFNQMYAELDFALQSGASEIKVGQTASQFKIRLGCTQRPLHLFIKGAGFFSSVLLKLCFRPLFPTREDIQPADIYNSRYKAGNSLDQTVHE